MFSMLRFTQGVIHLVLSQLQNSMHLSTYDQIYAVQLGYINTQIVLDTESQLHKFSHRFINVVAYYIRCNTWMTGRCSSKLKGSQNYNLKASSFCKFANLIEQCHENVEAHNKAKNTQIECYQYHHNIVMNICTKFWGMS